MAVKYSKIFTVTGAITGEPVTILVEYIEAEGFRGISIESLEGEYQTTEEFSEDSNRVIKESTMSIDKIYNFFPLMLPDTHRLVEALNEALQASEEG